MFSILRIKMSKQGRNFLSFVRTGGDWCRGKKIPWGMQYLFGTCAQQIALGIFAEAFRPGRCAGRGGQFRSRPWRVSRACSSWHMQLGVIKLTGEHHAGAKGYSQLNVTQMSLRTGEM